MNLQQLCEETVVDVDGCLGCALVDLATGLPLASRVVAGSLLGQAGMDLLSAASVEYFRGRMVWQLELAMSGGQTDGQFVHEIQTTTEDTYSFMSVVPGRETTLLVLVLDKAANLGLGWISMRQVLARLGADESDHGAAAVPGNAMREPSVIMPPAFATDSPRQASIGLRSESPRGSHVPYREVSAGEEQDAGANANKRSESAGRQWRGGRGGRRHIR